MKNQRLPSEERGRSPTPIDIGAALMAGANPDQVFGSRKKNMEKKFPSTPRSVEKQKAIMATKLKRLLEQNLRLKSTNEILKENNGHVLS
jgi:hypothetical protein